MCNDFVEQYKNLINFFGNQQKTAEALGVKQPSVSAWITGRASMRESTAMKAEFLTNGEFTAVSLSPVLAITEQFKAQYEKTTSEKIQK